MLDVPFGHRYVGYYEQEQVNSRQDIIKIIEEHLAVDNIAISISTYMHNEPYLLFLPFDFDADKLRDAWDDAKRLYNYLVRENYSAYLSYSGRKGFHVYILTIPKIYSRKQLRVAQNHFKNLLSLSTVDQQIFGDIRRLMRVPGTFNLNGGVCRILARNEGERLDLDEIYEDLELPIDRHSRTNGESRFHKYPCIESIVRSDSEPRHLIRFSYVILRLDQGWSHEEILNEIKSFKWIDFDPNYTLKQINHIDGMDYSPLSCNSLRDLNFCCIENCPYKKSIDDKLREIGII
jgi:hypothetical protein